jgi:putative proteasome-type protease
MTYCVAMRLNRGLVFAADTRTSAGNDNVAAFRKLYYWRRSGQRVIVLCSAGNLAITQSVVSLLNEQLVEELSPGAESLFTVPSLYRVARLVGEALREVRKSDGPALESNGSGFNANFLLGGQIDGEAPRLFHIYPEALRSAFAGIEEFKV